MDGFGRGGAGRRAGLWRRWLVVACLSWQLAVGARAQLNSTANATTASNVTTSGELDARDLCVGVFLKYEVLEAPEAIPPFSPKNLSNQPYSFDGTVTIINVGYEKLDLWELSIDFQHREVISAADGVLILSSQPLPGIDTTNDTRIVGTTTPNLLTSIDTAYDLERISTKFDIIGTEFGVNGTNGTMYPLPKSIQLVNKGYDCLANASAPNNTIWVCCTENSTLINSTLDGFVPRKSGDIIMSYDVMSAYSSSYTAQVSIVMNDPIGRLDNWNLTWHWTGGELIKSMKGGQVLGPNEQNLCVYGLPAIQYPGEDFSTYQSCSSDPVIVDLDQYQYNVPEVAIPYCCRNGTLLPDLIDPTKSRSDFQLTVVKLAPHTKLEDIQPPTDWSIGEGYKCGEPERVSPAEFEPAALHSSSSVASWQVVCNATKDDSPKKCCVSFSAYYNDSLVPCPTCSCGGCESKTFPWNGDSCTPGIDALLLPYQAVLLPPSNRTALATQLANNHHRSLPRPFPCPDNCGVNLNWHVYSDYTNGWSARVTLFNWGDQAVVNWSTAIQMPAAMPGFQEAYSFNNTKVPLADIKEFSELNNTVFLQGRNDYFNNYLIGKDSKDIPGKLQSILSFDKRKTPGIKVVDGDGFPTKVWFNGEECELPSYFPTGDGRRLLPTFQFAIIIAVTIFLMAGNR